MAVLEAPHSAFGAIGDIRVVVATVPASAVLSPQRNDCGFCGAAEFVRVGGEVDGGTIVVREVVRFSAQPFTVSEVLAAGEQVSLVQV